jgi:serine protease Do
MKRSTEHRRAAKAALLFSAAMACATALAAAPGGNPLPEVIDQVQPKVVKVYGAGGFRGMEGYQSGLLISAEGHLLTVWSYVLDTEDITAVLWDGRRFAAKLIGADPGLEVAVLKIDAGNGVSGGLPHFDLAEAVRVADGSRVLAFSNLFGVAMGDEPASVQDGVVSVITTLSARRGIFETPYHGTVYIIDAITNNPGAAGGALVTRRGQLTAMLGKQLRNALNNTWLNYAIPIDQLRKSVDEIRAGKFVARREKEPEKKPARALKLAALGITLVPDVLERTPPYVDSVRAGSPAAAAGIRPDDLIVLLGDRLIQSCKSLLSELEYIDYEEQIKLTMIRGQDLLDVTLQASPEDRERTP